ncbi:hypothetical protein [Thalassobaculum sp.]|uniref:tetratricopeptide repeat protein n=1 Tax=Thalassobaculum sp. TaxID=2022740 RepID=UPI0032EF3E43
MTGTVTLTDQVPSADTLLARARAAWGAGRTEDAIHGWRQAIVTAPGTAAPYVNLAAASKGRHARRPWIEQAAAAAAVGDPAIARNLGVLAKDRGETENAMWRLRQSLLISPENASTISVFAKLCSHGAASDDALRWYAYAAVSNPYSNEIWVEYLTRLSGAGRTHEAVAAVERLPIPDGVRSPELLLAIAHVYSSTLRNAEAMVVLKSLAALQPLAAMVRTMLAIQYRRSGDHKASVREGRRAVLLTPDSFHCLGALGSELVRAERFGESVRAHRRGLIVDPSRRAECLANFGAGLVKVNALDEARSVLREAMVRQPEVGSGYMNLSTLAFQACDLPSASRLGRFSLLAAPSVADAYYNLAVIRRHQSRLQESRTLFDQAVDLDDRPMFRFSRAMLELGDGDPADGVRRYEVRWQVPSFSSSRRLGSEPTLAMPVWQGEHRPDARLAVWGEQGIGDELWFASYLSWAAGRVGHVVLELAGSLVRTMARSFPNIEVRGRGESGTEEAVAACDLQASLGGLMLPFGAGTKPVPTGYLRPDAEQTARLRKRYAAGRPGKRIVGVSWRSIKPVQVRSFEVPLDAWEAVFALEDTIFVSLQYGDVSDDVRLVRERFGVELITDPEINAYENIDGWGAQVAAMDTVVSVANSTVAMAHGLGKPVHVVTRIVQDDWRYARGSETTRWLPTARCAWQTQPDDWVSPMSLVANRVRRGQ